MQISQVIGGVNGDTSAQAIELRMRSPGQNILSLAPKLVVVDATGSNPITLITFSADVRARQHWQHCSYHNAELQKLHEQSGNVS